MHQIPYYEPNKMPEIKKKRHIRLTSLFFTLGLLLVTSNFFLEVVQQFQHFQPHALGGSIVAFGASLIAQIADPA